MSNELKRLEERSCYSNKRVDKTGQEEANYSLLYVNIC